MTKLIVYLCFLFYYFFIEIYLFYMMPLGQTRQAWTQLENLWLHLPLIKAKHHQKTSSWTLLGKVKVKVARKMW